MVQVAQTKPKDNPINHNRALSFQNLQEPEAAE
jgi:hypothetical protein